MCCPYCTCRHLFTTELMHRLSLVSILALLDDIEVESSLCWTCCFTFWCQCPLWGWSWDSFLRRLSPSSSGSCCCSSFLTRCNTPSRWNTSAHYPRQSMIWLKGTSFLLYNTLWLTFYLQVLDIFFLGVPEDGQAHLIRTLSVGFLSYLSDSGWFLPPPILARWSSNGFGSTFFNLEQWAEIGKKKEEIQLSNL